MRWGIVTAAAMAAATGACASYSEKVAATYVSPSIYENRAAARSLRNGSCLTTRSRSGRLSGQPSHEGFRCHRRRHRRVLAGGILGWWRQGNAAELARLKGEMDALEQTSIKKNCGIQFRQG
jgi:hypothetical protein